MTLFAVVIFGKAESALACGGSLAASLGLNHSVSCPITDLGPPDQIYFIPPAAGPSYSNPGFVGIPQWQMPNGQWTGTPGLCWYTWTGVPVSAPNPPDFNTPAPPGGYNAYDPSAANTYSIGYGASSGGANCNVPYEHLYIWQDTITGRETIMNW